MTVLENLLVAQHNRLMLASGYTLLGVLGFPSYAAAERAAIDKARAWLDRVGLTARADDPAGDLPYGAQRRLEIARAMCTDPVLLCLDEPAAGLNPRESAELNELLLAIRDDHGISILLIEHDMSVVMEISDHVVVLDYGVKIADGEPGGGAQRSQGDRRLSRRRRRGSRQSRSGGRAMSAPLLSVRGVKTFYGRVMALKGVDLDVNDGEIVTLIGANGAGKSTLMMTICGNPRAREGTIVFAGRDITQLPTHEIARLKLAQAPEGRRIFSRMTVLENLQMGATTAEPTDFERDLERVLTLFPRLQAAPRPARRHAVGRRAADAGDRARADGRPRLLLLDEPSLGLAPLIVRQIFDAIKTLNAQDGLTVFLVEQNAFHALKLAHRGYVMVNGLITLSGSGRELLERPEIKSAYLEGGRQTRSDARRCQDLLYEEGSFGVFLLVTIMLGGGAAALAGRAIAATWRPWWQVVAYSLILGGAVRFIISPCSAARCCRSTIIWSTARSAWRSALLGFRATRAAQMVTQYRWLNVPDGPLRWRRKPP